ncbi:GntR family transcriptional regulator [Arsenicitalea aurantiaca]|uniref:GntR family transcriptional regulator n=1 Tax=Arsenicitalea aurantiaca TaxID=1783274 RepID=A0A433X3H0_9HYPH|nr:GntR family transcriptional regulator [Arsenicitalea aurantiaca]RUT28606.1 GntR family transcriptional regulator [Arsenicitalea aurantiaca]
MKAEPTRLNEVVYRVLAGNIAAGRVPPGVPIRESDVARLLSVSRVPARAALLRLVDEGLMRPASGRGFVVDVPLPSPEVRRIRFEDLDLVVPLDDKEELEHRNWRQRLFDEIEIEVAAALAFGRFGISESRLAAHLGVSRTVAHEFLSRLDRSGVVRQMANGRWQAGPLTDADIRNHYAMRQALEPVALVDAMPHLQRSALEAVRERLETARRDPHAVDTAQMLALETDLHVGLVLKTPNGFMADAIRRSQLAVLSTHVSFVTTRDLEPVRDTVAEHIVVLDAMLAGHAATAGEALRAHLEHARETTLERLSRLDLSDYDTLPDFLVPLDEPEP